MNKREFRYFVSYEFMQNDKVFKADRIYTFDYQPKSLLKGFSKLYNHICKEDSVEVIQIVSITEIYRRPKMQFYRKPRKS